MALPPPYRAVWDSSRISEKRLRAAVGIVNTRDSIGRSAAHSPRASHLCSNDIFALYLRDAITAARAHALRRALFSRDIMGVRGRASAAVV